MPSKARHKSDPWIGIRDGVSVESERRVAVGTVLVYYARRLCGTAIFLDVVMKRDTY
jgi:hypothetical protein